MNRNTQNLAFLRRFHSCRESLGVIRPTAKTHNLYSGYWERKHKILALHNDPDTPVLIVSAIGLLAVVALAILT